MRRYFELQSCKILSVLGILILTISCSTHDRNNPFDADVNGGGLSSSSKAISVWCDLGSTCISIAEADCFANGGAVVAVCSGGNTEVSSSSGEAEMVVCLTGNDCYENTLDAEECAKISGEVVEACPVSSSSLAFSSSSSLTLSSSSSQKSSSSSSEQISSSSEGAESSSSLSDSSSSSMETVSSSSESSSTSISSSSVAQSDLCADFDPNAEVEHYGKMKKQICDERDGQRYVYVTIGEQTWMAENLNIDPATISGWEGATNSWCLEGASRSMSNPLSGTQGCDLYGRLYDWSTAMGFTSNCNNISCSEKINAKHQGICPNGWHIPTQDEWIDLADAVGGASLPIESELKSNLAPSAGGWATCMTTDLGHSVYTDNYGFSALPSGLYDLQVFGDIGCGSSWWLASDLNGDFADQAHEMKMWYENEYLQKDGYYFKRYGQSIRCIKNN